METFKITTDETLRETIQHGNNRYPFAYYPDNIWKFDFHRIDWHWHHESASCVYTYQSRFALESGRSRAAYCPYLSYRSEKEYPGYQSCCQPDY